jgi:ribosomal protein S18 acetylase RimI-like enzyme
MPACIDVVRIRRARPTDARAIAQVHVDTWQAAYRDLLPSKLLTALSVERRAAFWESELKPTPAERMPWIAESNGEVVGFVSSGPSRDADAIPATGEVYAIYVLPDCWDKGVGRDLLRHAEHDLLADGYSVASLWVLAGNVRARQFYERSGWSVDATRTDEFGDVEVEEVRYRKRLEASRLG